MKNWIHFLPSILNQGRVSHFIEVPDDNPEPEEFQKKEKAELLSNKNRQLAFPGFYFLEK